ncbi:MAG: hypothetical protein ACI8QZ_001109 [Chlamydiales bacterium]
MLGVAVALASSGVAGRVDETRQQRVDSLAARSAAADDDWETEVLSSAASESLHAVLDALAADPTFDATPWISRAATCRALVPQGGESHTLGDLRLRRVTDVSASPGEEPGARPIADALIAWLAPMRESGPPRVAFKIVGVDANSRSQFSTTLLVTASGRRAGREVQQNATWRVTWSWPVSPESPGGTTPARLEGVECLRFEDVSASGPLFEECTDGVLPADPELRRQLANGGEHWFGRIDALGDWNYFGHNGLAVGDANGDGLDDLYVAMGTGLPNKLLIRQPDGTVVDRALAAGVAWLDDTKGVLFLDYDNDGDQDLFCALGPTILVSENDGEGTFTPARSLRAVTDAAFYSLAAADFDLDGDLDLYATRYVKTRYGASLPVPFHDAHNGPRNHLMRNDYPDGFTDVTEKVGLGVGNDRFSLAASWQDYDLDGDPDLYVANDFGRNNLFRNDGGTFVEIAALAGAEDMSAGMGVSWGDVDLDGDPDLLVSNMFSAAGQRVAYQPRFEREREDSAALIQRHTLGNTLLLNDGAGGFQDVSASAGVRMGRWAWGSVLADLTGDGYPDMTVPNGFLTNARDDDL